MSSWKIEPICHNNNEYERFIESSESENEIEAENATNISCKSSAVHERPLNRDNTKQNSADGHSVSSEKTASTHNEPQKITARRRSKRLASRYHETADTGANDKLLKTDASANAGNVSALPRRRGRPPKTSKGEDKQTNASKSSATATVTVTENQSESESPLAIGEKLSRKRKCSNTRSRNEDDLNAAVMKYFVDFVDQQQQPQSLAAADHQPDDNGMIDLQRSADSNPSAKCTICNQRRQYKRGCVWNLRSHFERV